MQERWNCGSVNSLQNALFSRASPIVPIATEYLALPHPYQKNVLYSPNLVQATRRRMPALATSWSSMQLHCTHPTGLLAANP